MPSFLALALVLLVPIMLNAQDSGVYGHTWRVDEEDLVDVMKRRLSDYEGATNWPQQLQLNKDPKPVPGIRVTREYSVHYIDPSIQAPQPIKDLEGRVIVQKGTRINPLSIVEMKEPILFFDGSDERQVAWAKSQPPSAKWVLVKGSPIDLENQENRPVFFDQHGVLCRRLAITTVPIIVSQSGYLLKIESIGLKESNKYCLEVSSNHVKEDIRRSIRSLEVDNKAIFQESNKEVEPSIWVAVSFSMPTETWVALSKEMEDERGAVFVVRGLPNNSWTALVEKISMLKQSGVLVPIMVDPHLFRRHDIQSVPCIVTERGKVSGNVSLSYALSQVGA